jgi:restriction system protein
MKSFYRIMLGRKSIHSEECFAGNFIGIDFGIEGDLTAKLSDDNRAFNREYVPTFLAKNPTKSKVVAGLAGGATWTVCKGMQLGDIAICPDGSGHYRVGEIKGAYFYQPNGILPHRRPVLWHNTLINRADMSEGLKNSTGSIGTISDVTKHAIEIEKLIGGIALPILASTDVTVEDPMAFALEEHLEDFLVKNWQQTELGKDYDIFEDDGDRVGQQYKVDTGTIDILAVSKSKKELLIVELKKGRASDIVVGQILRYMGYVQEELAEADQTVHGVIIALEDDQKIRRALSMVRNIEFYRYQIGFKLQKA